MLRYYNEQYIMINKCEVTTMKNLSRKTNVNLLHWTLYHDKQMLIYYNEVYIMIKKCYIITLNTMPW